MNIYENASNVPQITLKYIILISVILIKEQSKE